MTGIFTDRLHVDLATNFIEDVKSANNNYFVFTGKSTPWPDDQSPPPANNSPASYDQDFYDDLLYGKKITNNNIILSIPRRDWANNTKYVEYDMYRENSLDSNSSFFVFNSNESIRSVFKVIESGQGNSVVAPAIISTTPFRTSDGYVWKYMYTVSSSDLIKFGSNEYVPLTPNSTITESAIKGSIDSIKVVNGGAGWTTFNVGSVQSVINSTALIVSANASSNNDFYNGSTIYLKSGLGSGQLRTIIDYDGTSKTLFMDTPLEIKTNLVFSNVAGTFAINDTLIQNLVALSITSQFGYMQPGDSITQSQTGATGTIITANSSYLRIKPLSALQFNNIDAIDAGRGTTLGNSTVTVNTTSNTVVAAGNALFLSFYNIGSYIKVGQHFHRVVSVANNTSLTISGPFGGNYTANTHTRLVSAATVASVSNISATGTVKFTDLNSSALSIANATGNFTVGEIVTQSTASTNGIVSFANSSKLIITNIQGPGFVTNNIILGVASNKSANVQSIVNNPTVSLDNVVGGFILGSEVISSSGGVATVSSTTLLPNEQTEYVISPKINVVGDGVNAAAYCIVNTNTTAISSVIVVDSGTNYSHANATVTANPNYGSGANLIPLVSPTFGHGGNTALELGAKYVTLVTTFSNTYNENYNLPGSGKFRSVGVIKNPQVDNIFLSVTDYDRVTIDLNGSNTFIVGSILYQSNLASGVVTYANTSRVELSNVKGSFDKNNANITLSDTTSITTSQIANVNVNRFTVTSNTTVIQETSRASGKLVSANSTLLRLTNVTGTLSVGNRVYDPTINAYANVTSITTANNTETYTFNYFNQLSRVSLSQLTGNFIVDEDIVIKTPIGTEIATGTVYNVNNDIDLTVTYSTGSFINNEIIIQNGSTSGVLLSANSSYLKLTNVVGSFIVGANVVGASSNTSANITQIQKVITVGGVKGTLTESNTNVIVGLTSNAQGYSASPNTIIRPTLIRDTGSVIYLENIQPVTRTSISTEAVKLVIKF